MLGSDSGSIVQACENLSQEILLHLANNDPIYERPKTFVFGEGRNKLCDKLDREGACLVIDAINGSIPQCLAKHSVYHNVGVLDPAKRSILSWSEVDGNEGCVDGAKEKERQRKMRYKRRQEQKRLLKERAAKERIKKAQETRERTKQEQAANAAAKVIQNSQRRQTQTLGRAARAAAREAVEKRKRNNNVSPNNQPTKKTKAQTPVVKRERNNNTLNNRPVKKVKSTPTPVTASRPPRPPRSIREALPRIPESVSARRETRSASATRSRRNAPASAGTRSGVRTPGRTPKSLK